MKQLLELLQIKKLIAIVLTSVFAIQTLRGAVTMSEFITVFASVIGFYFGQSSARQAIQENNRIV